MQHFFFLANRCKQKVKAQKRAGTKRAFMKINVTFIREKKTSSIAFWLFLIKTASHTSKLKGLERIPNETVARVFSLKRLDISFLIMVDHSQILKVTFLSSFIVNIRRAVLK